MKKRLIAIGILIAYSAILIKVMVFKDLPVIRIGSMMFRFGGAHEGAANLVPFKTILPYLLGEKRWLIAVINLAGNIVLLVPIGMLVPFVSRNITWKKMLVIAGAAGVAIEGMQVLLRVGIFDIDDVILNALGVLLGYWAFVFFAKRLRLMKTKNIIIAAAVVITIGAAGAYYAVSVFQQMYAPMHFESNAETLLPDSIDTREDSIPQGPDPCNGTGGTGQIVSVGNNSITIKRHDGISVVINFTETTIRNSVGLASRSDLKRGEKVTVVVGVNHGGGNTATTVLVCNDAGAGTSK